jgi:hypothetical protein
MPARFVDVKVNFETGKHAGKPLEVVMFDDPGYLYWYSKQELFYQLPALLQKKIRFLIELADSLRIPGNCRECNKHTPPRRMVVRIQAPDILKHIKFVCNECDPGTSQEVKSLPLSFNYLEAVVGQSPHNISVFREAIAEAYWKKPWHELTQHDMIKFWGNKNNFKPKGKIGISL